MGQTENLSSPANIYSPSSPAVHISKHFSENLGLSQSVIAKKLRTKSADMNEGKDSTEGEGLKPKMHHLKGTQELLQKSYLNPVKNGVHNSYLKLNPNRVPSSRSHDSIISSVASDLESGKFLIYLVKI